MLTQTGLYALQALLYLTGRGMSVQVSASAMAEELQIPPTYLAKILQRLAREDMLVSARGPNGGYRLLKDPSELTVAEAVTPFQDLRTSEVCLLGGPCDVDNPCTAHARRAAWNDAMLNILEETTLADLLSGVPLRALVGVSEPIQERPK